jgi:DNA-binding response OmpR family regulator
VGKPRILIVDDQTEVLRLALKALAAGDYDLRTSPDGAEAFLLAREWGPDLVVTDVTMPKMDGWALVKQLRSNAKLALVPVIFLTSRAGSEERMQGFRLGADDYLDKSTGFWELPERVTKALGRARDLEASVSTPSAGGGLTGRCDVIGLAALLNVLEATKQSGILRLKRAVRAEEGFVYFVGGRVRRAEIKLAPEKNAEALYALVSWTDGSFEFSPGALRVSDDVGMTAAQILVEAARRMDAKKT